MKRTIIVILILVLCVLVSFLYAYNTYISDQRNLKNFNKEFENYYDKEIFGSELATVINKVIDNNVKNNIEKDFNGNYIENNEDSIKMDIYIIDSDMSYAIEKIYSLGTGRFVQNFDTAKFKCTRIEYHEKTKKVKYIYFEQTSN